MDALRDSVRILRRPTLGRTFRHCAKMLRLAEDVFDQATADAVRMFEGMGVPYTLIGGVNLGVYNFTRATEDVDFAIPADRLDEVLEGSFNYGFNRVHHGTETSRITLRHRETKVPVQLMTEIPSILQDSLTEGVTVDVGGKDMTVLSLALLILSKLVAGRGKDLVDVEGLILKNPELLNLDSPDNQEIRETIQAHPNGPDLDQVYLDAIGRAQVEWDSNPMKYRDRLETS